MGGVWIQMNQHAVCGLEDVLICLPKERIATGMHYVIWTVATGNHSGNGHITSSARCYCDPHKQRV
jgi:hypothetical protein